MAQSKPLILLSSCNKLYDGDRYISLRRRYVEALQHLGALPLVLPAVTKAEDLAQLVATSDGVLFTGSPSNVHPRQYHCDPHAPDMQLDEDRDHWSLPLIRLAIAESLPLLAICRGIQEFNVAFGGTLHQYLPSVAGIADHMPFKEGPPEYIFAAAHDVSVAEGSLLDRILGETKIRVNSRHNQGIDRLGQHLLPIAYSDDGVIEAITHTEASAFNLGVQWHPEWNLSDDLGSQKILGAFVDDCRRRALQKLR